jgi:chemotaxis protein CheD
MCSAALERVAARTAASSTPDGFASHIYFDRNFDCQGAKVLPGEYYVTDREMLIMTVLGSCVAACIRDRVTGIGGMNHFMLPDGGDADSPVSTSMRYGSYAMEMLINRLLKSGARRENLEAKVFGGGSVLPGMTKINVGDRNAAFVRQYLKIEGIRIVAEDLNATYPRKVVYFPKTGRALMKKLGNDTADRALIQTETEYTRRINVTTEVEGDVELF